MNKLQRVVNQYPESEREIFWKIWKQYRSGLDTGQKKNPDSIRQRAKSLGISPQALWEREKRKNKN